MITYDIVPFFCFFSHAHNHTQKKDFVWIILKDWTYFFKTRHLVIRLHSNTCTKDYDHSPTLICTRGVFNYQVMTGGVHVYPILVCWIMSLWIQKIQIMPKTNYVCESKYTLFSMLLWPMPLAQMWTWPRW